MDLTCCREVVVHESQLHYPVPDGMPLLDREQFRVIRRPLVASCIILVRVHPLKINQNLVTFPLQTIQQIRLTYSVQMLVSGPLLIMICLSWTDSTTPSKIFPFSGLKAIMSNLIEKMTSPVVSWTTPIRSS